MYNDRTNNNKKQPKTNSILLETTKKDRYKDRKVSPLKIVYGHTTGKKPVLVRSPQSSPVGPGKYEVYGVAESQEPLC
ncbi:hypothetical protein AC249_AIPGENE4142 [Exaiptasia diaphana]|nr:hypothetical protein AC249_AIPGENE4142 [Exaiptasia diaphana]